MRILAGSSRGQWFAQPKTQSVRPLSDKVRAAIFDVTGAPTGMTVLDAYAGAGSAGFEAISRGAVLVEAIEANRLVARVIEASAKTLSLGLSYILHVTTVETWLASPAQIPPAPRYNLIIADPPYAKLDTDVLQRLITFLRPGGVLVVSHSSKHTPPMLKSAQLAVHKTYGDTSLSFYQPA